MNNHKASICVSSDWVKKQDAASPSEVPPRVPSILSEDNTCLDL